jgi:hypothetical protein
MSSSYKLVPSLESSVYKQRCSIAPPPPESTKTAKRLLRLAPSQV